MATQKNERRPARQPEKKAQKGPEVVYTPGKPFQRSRLILQLLTVFALVVAIFLGISVFFKVDRIEVSGANKHSVDAVAAVSGIEKGDSLFFFGRASAYSRIKQELAYVKEVRFGIELPGTVKIYIEEVPVVYAIQDSQNGWWLMDASGRITEKSDSAAMLSHTQVLGVALQEPQVGSYAVAYEPPVTPETDPEDQEQAPVVSYEADKLEAALEILQQLEANEILGKVTKVDVSNHQALEFTYGERFQVELGDSGRLDYKIALVKAAIAQMGQQTTGILDASLQTVTEGIHYKPLD